MLRSTTPNKLLFLMQLKNENVFELCCLSYTQASVCFNEYNDTIYIDTNQNQSARHTNYYNIQRNKINLPREVLTFEPNFYYSI